MLAGRLRLLPLVVIPVHVTITDVFQMSLERLNFSRKNIPKHSKVSHQRIDGMLERGRAIFLNDEMAIPSKAVTQDRHQRQEPPVTGEKRSAQSDNHKARADEVETAVL